MSTEVFFIVPTGPRWSVCADGWLFDSSSLTFKRIHLKNDKEKYKGVGGGVASQKGNSIQIM